MGVELNRIAIFQQKEIRKVIHQNEWRLSVVDVVQALTDQPDFQSARKYWNKLAERLRAEGSEVVTNCHRLKLKAPDGKLRETTVPILKAFSDLSSSCNYCGSVFQ